MSQPEYVRISEVMETFIIDGKTARSALRREGLLIRLGPRTHRVRREDFERMKERGFPYYHDLKPCRKKINQ